MKKENISYREHAERGTTVYVAVDGKYAGCIVIDDTIKPQSKEAVAMMKKHGLDVELLTGDNQASAAAVAKEVGIETCMLRSCRAISWIPLKRYARSMAPLPSWGTV